jgi:hypothetical protein
MILGVLYVVLQCRVVLKDEGYKTYNHDHDCFLYRVTVDATSNVAFTCEADMFTVNFYIDSIPFSSLARSSGTVLKDEGQ